MPPHRKQPAARARESRVISPPINIANAVVIKNDDIFFLAQHGGAVPMGNEDGFGLYYHDCRYLNGYEVQIAGTRPNVLVSTSDQGSMAWFEFTNVKLDFENGRIVPAQKFGISLERLVDSESVAVHDTLTVTNYGVETQDLPLSFQMRAGFEDVFEIRGLRPKRIGRVERPQWDNGVLSFNYDGADGILRSLEVHVDPKPKETSSTGASFFLHIAAGQAKQVKLSLRILESHSKKHLPKHIKPDPTKIARDLRQHSQEWLAECAGMKSDDPLLDDVMQRSLKDLRMLRSSLDDCRFFSAGLPWYGALFGRDSIVAALQMLAYEPGIAEQTIRLLAKFQGTKVDEWRDEQPGKILHELRRGELANLNEIPQTPYYGSVDSTPLFLVLIGEHSRWTGDLELFKDMRQHIERALEWIDDLALRMRTPYALGLRG